MIALNVDFANYNFTLHIRMSPHLSFCLSSSLFFFLSCLPLHFLLLMHHYSLSNLHYLALIILKTSSEDEVALNCIQEPFKCCRGKYLAISDITPRKKMIDFVKDIITAFPSQRKAILRIFSSNIQENLHTPKQ